jgi:hypothetical protein
MAQNNPASADSPRYLFGTPQPVAGISALGEGEDAPSLSYDGRDFYFSSNSGRGVLVNDLYVAHRDSKGSRFGTPVPLDSLNTDRIERDPTISSDGLTLYYLAGDVADNANFSGEIWTATRTSRDQPFGNPTLLFAPPPGWGYYRPSVSSDGRSLYLQFEDLLRWSSDVYVARRESEAQPWGEPETVKELTDPNRWQGRPFISADNLTLFFYDSGFNGSLTNQRGNGDLGMLVRPSVNTPWSAPVNLGNTINSVNDYEDISMLSADGQTFYFSRYYFSAPDWWNSAEILQASVLPFDAVDVNGSGGTYSQDFNSLVVDGSADTALPAGWTFTANDIVFNNATTDSFSTTAKQYTGVYNAGTDGATDRTLVTDVTRNETGELDFRTLVTDSPLQALRLGFDIEAWQLRRGLGANLGEAAFHVVLEADSGNGFQQVADLGEFSTGKTLARPATGNLVDGNDPAYSRSFDTGPVDVGDVPAGATLRARWIGTEGSRNVVFGLDNVSLRFAAPGDAKIDGLFNSLDLLQVLQNGEYNDVIVGNSTWAEGDWNNDGEFDSLDLVAALQGGGSGQALAVMALVPEPSSALLGLIALGALLAARRLRQ